MRRDHKGRIGSGHGSVRVTLRINKRLARLKTIKRRNLLISTNKNLKA